MTTPGKSRDSFRLQFGIRSLLLLMLSVAIICKIYSAIPLDSLFVPGLAYFAAWIIPGASFGFDLRRSSRGAAWGAIIATVFGGLLLFWLMQPVPRE
jgi:hypothetical protein